ncbi:MAG: polysaccharide biosynthesis protein, partial [Armatimonadetes bacterium CG17_big_fil_post_rev_8_21_14_2_50_66_6]
MSQNVPLKAGDTVLVAALETIQVAGQVRSPGVYPLKENDRLSDVLTSAGWPTEQAGLNNVA